MLNDVRGTVLYFWKKCLLNDKSKCVIPPNRVHNTQSEVPISRNLVVHVHNYKYLISMLVTSNKSQLYFSFKSTKLDVTLWEIS